MSDGDWYVAKRVMQLRVAEEHKLAEGRTLARITQQGKPGGLIWHGRWLVCRLGYQLVALGAWLEGHSLPEAQPVKVES